MVKKLVKKSDNLCRSANYNILIQDNEDEKSLDPPATRLVR